MKLALKLAQVTEQGRDLRGLVFITLMQANEGIQNQQQRSEGLHGQGQSLAIGGRIQAKGRSGDHLQREIAQRDPSGSRDAVQASADDTQGVLGGKEQDRAGASDREVPQTGSPGSHGQGYIQSQERFAALGFSAQDADGFLGPELLDEPGGLPRSRRELIGSLDRKGIPKRAGVLNRECVSAKAKYPTPPGHQHE